MLAHLVLVEYSRALWIQPDCQQGGNHVPSLCPKTLRRLWHRDGVQADNGKEKLIFYMGSTLYVDPITHRPKEIAQLDGGHRYDYGSLYISNSRFPGPLETLFPPPAQHGHDLRVGYPSAECRKR